MFRRLNGARRQGVIVRHNVKRRWEKLGVWNPEWGFAGRKMQRNDCSRTWKWTWQQHDRPDGADPDARELVARALRLRRNLRRGEHAPMLPRSRPGQDTTAAQAEAFLISQIELAEERARYYRLSLEDKERYPYSGRNQVIEWWKERGDWRDEFNKTDWVTGWKWRHESPSPEPEDLTPIDIIRDSPLEAAEDMEFTPSEIDELEAIELPESEQPEGFWVIEDGDLPPLFPGQIAEGREIPVDPGVKFFIEKFFPGPGPIHLFGPPQAVQHEESSPEEHEASIELQEDASEPQREAACPPPQKRRRLRQHQPRDGVDGAQDQDQPLPPPPRRSARIAGTKRPAEPLSSQTAPNKRPRGGAALEAAASTAQPTSQETRRTRTRLIPTQPPPKEKMETRPKRGRGRPRKENGPTLLDRPGIGHIFCLNRGTDRGRAVQGARFEAAGLAGDELDDRVTFLQSYLAQPSLALDEANCQALQSRASLIIHNACPVNFNVDLLAFRRNRGPGEDTEAEPGRAVELVVPHMWLTQLEESVENATTEDGAGAAAKAYPAMKLVEFYWNSVWNVNGGPTSMETTLQASMATEKTLYSSPTLRDLPPVSLDWMRK
ncbi:hypothetical protein F4678DRAFT_456251 [Xylaria arbuscula]|nr:hypothetical protein F4678DRAFT_456251 [Xylaria arbuscula]